MSDTNNRENSEMEKLKKLIKTKKITEALTYLDRKFENEETILHVAIKLDEGDGDMIAAILERKPELVLREKTDEYKGQTPLHIAISKANTTAMKLMVKSYAKQGFGDDPQNTLNTCFATGKRFEGTVMMHQLPLFVAAVKFDIDMTKQLLGYGADVLAKNKNGDTIFHVLIHHLSLNRDKETEVGVQKMFEFFHNKLNKQQRHLWFTRNNTGMTPLKLAAQYKLVSAFEFILELHDVYCTMTAGEGSSYTKTYDVTEIDSIANIAEEKKRDQGSKTDSITNVTEEKKRDQDKETDSNVNKTEENKRDQDKETDSNVNKTEENKRDQDKETDSNVNKTEESKRDPDIETDSNVNKTEEKKKAQSINESVLEMMFDSDFDRQDCTAFMQLVPIKLLIEKKWKYYGKIYTAWMFVHFVFMICLTAYAVDRSTWHRNNASYAGTDIAEYFDNNTTSGFVLSFQMISPIIALGYLILAVIIVINSQRRPNANRYRTHNVEYIVFMFVMSIALIIDLIVTLSAGRHDSMSLILALFSGWWFCIFFLRGWEYVSTFTVMIKDVLLVDLPRFSVIMALQMFAFTTSMHTLFQGENVPNIDGSVYNNFGRTLHEMFNLMLGLGEIEDLNQARVPWLAITLFVLFTMVTYVLLLNALLAMMSTTCDKVLEEKYSVWRLQQLCVMLFLESIFCDAFLNFFYLNRILTVKPVEEKKEKTSSQNQCRYYFSIETEMNWTKEETETLKKSAQKEIDRTLKHILIVGMESYEY